MTSLIVFVPFLLLLLVAAGWDLATYTIPNLISVLLIVGFALFALTSGMSTSIVAGHFAAGAIALVVGFGLFAFGYIGGGDAKVFAAIAAWFGLHDLPEFVLLASVFGGALTLGLLTMRKFPLPAPLAAQDWILRLHEPRGGIPYGVALSAGAIVILPYTDIFHLAVG